MTPEKLLREYVREFLAEEGGDGGAGAIMAAGADMNPYGMHYGDEGDLYKIFVRPFADVVQTAAGKTKELSQKTQTLAKVAFESIVTSLIPFCSDNYKEIFAKEKQEMDKIRKEYGEIYQSNWDAFKDNDALLAAFLYSPVTFLTAQFARKSPAVAAKLISTLSGGTLDKFLKKVADKFPGWNATAGPTGLERGGSGKHSGGGGGGGGGWDMGYGGGGHSVSSEGRIREDKEGKKQPDLGSILTNDKVIAALQNSTVVKKMKQQGQSIVRNTLEQIFKQAQGVMSAKTLQDIQHKTGTKLQGLDKLAQVPEQERQKLEQTILAVVKKSMKSFYMKNLQGQIKQAVDGGIAQDSPYVQDYQNVINKIKQL